MIFGLENSFLGFIRSPILLEISFLVFSEAPIIIKLFLNSAYPIGRMSKIIREINFTIIYE